MQLSQNGHSCIVHHFRPSSDCSADGVDDSRASRANSGNITKDSARIWLLQCAGDLFARCFDRTPTTARLYRQEYRTERQDRSR